MLCKNEKKCVLDVVGVICIVHKYYLGIGTQHKEIRSQFLGTQTKNLFFNKKKLRVKETRMLKLTVLVHTFVTWLL